MEWREDQILEDAVEWWDDDTLRFGVVAGRPKNGKVRVFEIMSPAPGNGVMGRYATVNVDSIRAAESRVGR